MFRSFALAIFLSLSFISGGYAATDDDAYNALAKFATVSSKTINSAGCLITATADFDGFFSQISTFRDAWLNQDFSVDYYSQRRKAVFVYIVLKRFAEILTEGLYRNEKPPSCTFRLAQNTSTSLARIKSFQRSHGNSPKSRTKRSIGTRSIQGILRT